MPRTVPPDPQARRAGQVGRVDRVDRAGRADRADRVGQAGRPDRAAPTLRLERRLLRDGATRVAGMDEVGRGAPAGPVHVGVVVVDAGTPPAPAGVRDSKLLTPTARLALAPRIRAWAVACAVGWASAAEVDAVGVTRALRLAGQRALSRLEVPPDVVLLDGGYDWLTAAAAIPAPATATASAPAPADASGGSDGHGPAAGRPVDAVVVTKVKADLSCASVAAASVLAKVARDAVMSGLAADFPGYGWEANKGYGTAEHLEALVRLGPSPHHRVTWRLPVPT